MTNFQPLEVLGHCSETQLHIFKWVKIEIDNLQGNGLNNNFHSPEEVSR